jgi:hypothetical protein
MTDKKEKQYRERKNARKTKWITGNGERGLWKASQETHQE